VTPPEYGRGFYYKNAPELADELERAVDAFYPDTWCVQIKGLTWSIRESSGQFPHLNTYSLLQMKRAISGILKHSGWTQDGKGRNLKFIKPGCVVACTP
jgi:hypothetical protein